MTISKKAKKSLIIDACRTISMRQEFVEEYLNLYGYTAVEFALKVIEAKHEQKIMDLVAIILDNRKMEELCI